MTPHNNAKKGEIAKNVIMPGDPLRAKYIAEKYMEDYKLVNEVRGMYAYTGKYKGKDVTVMASGMGMPSMGIYSYELYKFYDVENIIRVGTAGANNKDIKLFDIVLSESSYSLSTFAKLFDGFKENRVMASSSLNNKIILIAKELNIDIKIGEIITSDVFDPYVDDQKKYEENYENFSETLASEMESFALLFMAKKLGKRATTLLTIVDSPYDKKVVSSEDREKSLDSAIILALESAIKY
ncbi:MAG: purine-nucleoside phosphorylase [Bacilli bacterium]|nr:purine-nucleoside phosphorylase [Bacilli bacterium]